MTARLDPNGSDGPDAALPLDAPADDPLAIFPREPQEVGQESGDGAALRMDAIPSQAPSVPFATPSVNDGKPRTAGVVNRIKSVLRALDISRDFEKTVDIRVAALRDLDQEVQDRAGHLERLNQEIIVREAAVVDAVEQLRRRAADTIDDLEGRVGDCEARAHIAEQTIRIVDLSGSHQQLDRLEQSVTQLEQRAAAAVGEVRQATRAKDELQREIANCQQQLERLTTAAQGEAEKLTGLRRHAEDHRGDRAASPSARDLLNTLRFRWPNTSWPFSPARLAFGGTAFALSAATILLVGIVWRISPVENQGPEEALPGPVLAGPRLTLAPTSAVTPPMPVTADIRYNRPEATRTAPAVPAVAVPRVSKAPVATRRVPTAAVREQSVRRNATTPQFVGTLFIESDPAGAAAFVNQKPVGDTPVLLKDLPAGSYVVRLEHEGYQRWSIAATVSAVRQERVRAKLERESSR